ncbi:MAG: fumarylacetoacetate hydrolase [Burkholderiaceae bacterium]
MPTIRLAATAGALALLAGCAGMKPDAPTCPSDAAIKAMNARYVALQQQPTPPADLTIAGAQCGRDKFARTLTSTHGPVIGYKAGLTNEAVQKRFNYPAPMWGTLNQKMILRNGASVPAQFGARPVFEADLVAVVKSAKIHDAKTPLEALSQISVIYPFIELPDLQYEDPSKLNGPALQLVNVGARYGVLGEPIRVQPTQAFLDSLRDMTVRLVGSDGRDLDSGKGSAILNQPLNAAIWLAGDLEKNGITLKEGDLLSLGSFTKLLQPKAGTTVWAVYDGLPGNPSVSVQFK